MIRDLNVDQIKKLWVLDLIIRTGSLKRAAVQAKVSPSAISQTLSSLERSVGKPLLIRDKAALTATAEAIEILQIVRPAFDAFERLRGFKDAPTPKMTWLNFGTYESIAIEILPGLLHRLRERMPNLRLGLQVSRTANLLSLVRKGELCSALVTEVDDLQRFHCERVGEDRLGFFVARRHPIGQLGWSAAVSTYGLGSLSPGKDGQPRYFQRFLRQAEGVKPAILSDSFETLRAAAAGGSLVAVLPARVAARGDDLLEISPPGKLRENGRHGLLVVSPLSCDHEESRFLADETRRLLSLKTVL